jgi:hypothetical protein
LHGVDPRASVDPPPPGLDRADRGLAAGMYVDMLNGDLLVAFAAVLIEGV